MAGTVEIHHVTGGIALDVSVSTSWGEARPDNPNVGPGDSVSGWVTIPWA
jgi:hypothetical protein